MPATILYRGPLERSRLSYLAESTALAYGATKLVWIIPQRVTKERIEHFQRFLDANPWIDDWEIIHGLATAFPIAITQLRRSISHRTDPVIAVGITSIFYAAQVAKGKLIWCINGIPEEDLLESQSLHKRIYTFALWRTARLICTPNLIVTVSNRMTQLVQKYWPSVPCFTAPNCVDIGIFAPQNTTQRSYMAYLGTGAPWQGIEKLAKIWGALYQLDKSLKFRVISRDERTKCLGRELPGAAIDYYAVEDPKEVARLLSEVEAGFLIRDSHLVNQVSFPTKFGEYVAAGAYIVTTDIGWDIGDIVRETQCGVLVAPDSKPEQIAKIVVSFRNNSTNQATAQDRNRVAAKLVERQTWVEKLADILLK